jgi:tRNA (guanine37-N1)-methyltransferase
MKIYIITLFPEMFTGVLNSSMLWKAQDKKIVSYELIDLRQFGLGNRKTVDDTPYGGGDGMLLRPEPLFTAVDSCKNQSPKAKVLLMTPRGYDYTQKDAERLAEQDNDLIIICGRYEGYDERITSIVDEQICIGHYVLTGGELAAMVVVDSVTRLIPGVLGGEQSTQIESFSHGDNREFPQYTRPEDYRGMKVPDVLLSGNHAKIAKWRDNQSINTLNRSSNLED